MASISSPDLVLMDLQLPGWMDTKLCCECELIRGAATIPVVAVTAFAMKDDIERADEAGFDG